MAPNIAAAPAAWPQLAAALAPSLVSPNSPPPPTAQAQLTAPPPHEASSPLPPRFRIIRRLHSFRPLPLQPRRRPRRWRQGVSSSAAYGRLGGSVQESATVLHAGVRAEKGVATLLAILSPPSAHRHSCVCSSQHCWQIQDVFPASVRLSAQVVARSSSSIAASLSSSIVHSLKTQGAGQLELRLVQLLA